MQPTRNFDKKITYYFGAGASANAIPTVNDLLSRLDDFSKFIKKEETNLKKGLIPYSFSQFKSFCDYWINQVKGVPSLDTLAKRFSDQKRTETYNNYKAFLVILFNYLHYYKLNPDKKSECINNSLEGRYENLIRSINLINGDANTFKPIPKNFNFITWNYDFHLELTVFRDLKTEVKLSEAMHSKIDFMGLGQYNLNGSSLLFDHLINTNDYTSQSVIKTLIDIYSELSKNPLNNPLKFAWEESNNIDFQNQRAKEAQYIVVIGYSFPTFNRDVDNAFFHNLKPDANVFTQGYDYADSVRIEKYLRQTFINEGPPFKITPVESPFFYVPAEYFLENKVSMRVRSLK
jgi:hypothetical protein